MAHDELKILDILLGERRKAQCAVGEVDTLVSAQLFTLFARTIDLHHRTARLDAFDQSANLSIVEPDRVAATYVIKYRGQCAADGGRRQQATTPVISCRPTDLEL